MSRELQEASIELLVLGLLAAMIVVLALPLFNPSMDSEVLVQQSEAGLH